MGVSEPHIEQVTKLHETDRILHVIATGGRRNPTWQRRQAGLQASPVAMGSADYYPDQIIGRRRQAERLGQSERIVDKACEAQREAQFPAPEVQDLDIKSMASGGLVDFCAVHVQNLGLASLRILPVQTGCEASAVLAGSSTRQHTLPVIPHPIAGASFTFELD